MTMISVFTGVFYFFVTYFLILTAYYLACGLVALFEVRRRTREHGLEEYILLSDSALTLPVSILIPAHNEEEWIMDTVKAALNLDYPETEIIVIDDGSTDHTFELLDKEFRLEEIPIAITTSLPTGNVRKVFRSRTRPRLTVINKETGQKKAGALNAGLEWARYPYVCTLDADTILESDALLKVMAHVLRDSENIEGAGSYFGLINGFRIENGRILERSFSLNPLIAYQNLEYLRSFIGMRSAWNRWGATPIIAGGFSIWRRETLVRLGGFKSIYSSEDLEVTFRVRGDIVKNKKTKHRILMLPYFVGWTEGPSTIYALVKQRNRWQRCLLEAVWDYRHMIANPRYGAFGCFVLPYFLLYEALGPLFEIASVVLTLWGWRAGVLSVPLLFSFFSLMILCQTLISLVSIFAFVRDQRVLRRSVIVTLILLAFGEFFWYRILIAAGKIGGTLGFLRGERRFDQYRRQRAAVS